MKMKTLIAGVLLTILIAACTPAQTVEEVVEPVAMQEITAETMEESDPNSDDAPAADEAAMTPEAETDVTAGEVSFSADVWPIFEEYALDAHGGKGGIFLESYDDILKQVVPGDPENSLLYKVLTGNGAPQMPPGNPLPEELVQTVYDWIKQGAKDN